MTLTNTHLVRWRSGQVEIADSGSQGTYGRSEGGLSIGDVADMQIVDQMARSSLAITKDPVASVVARMADVNPADGWSAYTDYLPGDTVNVRGNPERCASITINEDRDGNLDVDPEFITARDVYEQRYNRWLTRTNGGALEGRTATTGNASFTSASILNSSIATATAIPVASAGDYELVAGDETGPGKTPEIEGVLYRAEFDFAAAGVSDTEFEVTLNGVVIFTVVCLASVAETVYDLTPSETVIVEVGDILRVICTVAGGHTGLTGRLLVASTEI